MELDKSSKDNDRQIPMPTTATRPIELNIEDDLVATSEATLATRQPIRTQVPSDHLGY